MSYDCKCENDKCWVEFYSQETKNRTPFVYFVYKVARMWFPGEPCCPECKHGTWNGRLHWVPPHRRLLSNCPEGKHSNLPEPGIKVYVQR